MQQMVRKLSVGLSEKILIYLNHLGILVRLAQWFAAVFGIDGGCSSLAYLGIGGYGLTTAAQTTTGAGHYLQKMELCSAILYGIHRQFGIGQPVGYGTIQLYTIEE